MAEVIVALSSIGAPWWALLATIVLLAVLFILFRQKSAAVPHNEAGHSNPMHTTVQIHIGGDRIADGTPTSPLVTDGEDSALDGRSKVFKAGGRMSSSVLGDRLKLLASKGDVVDAFELLPEDSK